MFRLPAHVLDEQFRFGLQQAGAYRVFHEMLSWPLSCSPRLDMLLATLISDA